MGFDKTIADLMLLLRKYEQELEKNVADCKRIKLLKLELEEKERIEKIKKKYQLKREEVEKMPHQGNLGLQQKISALNEKIYMLHAQRIKNTTK